MMWERAEIAQKQDLKTFLDFGYIPPKKKDEPVKRRKSKKKRGVDREVKA